MSTRRLFANGNEHVRRLRGLTVQAHAERTQGATV